MIKEAKDIDFYTSGRQPSEQDFARISEWILKNKKKGKTTPVIKSQQTKKKRSSNKSILVEADN